MLFLWHLGKKFILNWFAEFSIGWMTFGNYPVNLHFFWQINFSLLLGHVKKNQFCRPGLNIYYCYLKYFMLIMEIKLSASKNLFKFMVKKHFLGIWLALRNEQYWFLLSCFVYISLKSIFTGVFLFLSVRKGGVNQYCFISCCITFQFCLNPSWSSETLRYRCEINKVLKTCRKESFTLDKGRRLGEQLPSMENSDISLMMIIH